MYSSRFPRHLRRLVAELLQLVQSGRHLCRLRLEAGHPATSSASFASNLPRTSSSLRQGDIALLSNIT